MQRGSVLPKRKGYHIYIIFYFSGYSLNWFSFVIHISYNNYNISTGLQKWCQASEKFTFSICKIKEEEGSWVGIIELGKKLGEHA